MAKRKIKRKELKQPDEFITLSTRILSWCRDNMRFVVGIAIGIVVVIIIISGALFFRANREARAETLYQEAVALLPGDGAASGVAEGEYAAAVEKLAEVQERYGSTTVALNGLVDLGNAYLKSGDYDQAISSYQDFLQKTSTGHLLRDPVLLSLGATYEAKPAWEMALEVYQRLYNEGGPAYQAQVQLCLGRVYEAIGDQKKAMGYYENYLAENPASVFSQLIQTKLLRWRLSESSQEQG